MKQRKQQCDKEKMLSNLIQWCLFDVYTNVLYRTANQNLKVMVRQLSFHRLKSGFNSDIGVGTIFVPQKSQQRLVILKSYTEEFNQFGNVNWDFRRTNTFSLHVAVLKGLPKNTKKKFVLVIE